MGKAVRRGKLLCKSVTLPSLGIHIDCRLLWGMLALMITAGDRRGGKFCREWFSGTFLCREAITHAGNWIKILCNVTLPPEVTHMSSEAQQISFQLFCLFLCADLAASGSQAFPASRKP